MKKLNLLTVITLLLFMQQVYGQAYLRVTDPQNNWNWRKGKIEKATLSVKPAGTYFEMGLYLTFSSEGTNFTGDRMLESYMNFSLPEGSIVLDSWLWVFEDIIQGKIIDKWTASNIYEGIVNRRRDPSILTKTGTDYYELRVYPMKPGELRKVKLTYLVPASWSNGKATIPLPTDILKASNSIPTLHTLLWLDEGWTGPEIPEMTGESFESLYDEEYGSYLRYDIPNFEVENGLSLTLDAPLMNGMYFTSVEDEADNGIYQIAVDFKQFLENDHSTKVAVLVDYESSNTSIPREQIFNTLEQNLLSNYTEKDSFNLFYSRYEIESYSENWVPITQENLSVALQPLKEGFLTLYSNLPGLLAKGNEFVEKNGGGQLALYSNADNYGSHDKANTLLKDIQSMNMAPVHIADFQNKNYSTWRINNRWYEGQEYLFINLSRITAGTYEDFEKNVNLNALCSRVFGSLAGSISAFEFYSTAANGFCYGRYNRSNDEIFHLGDYFIQTGKFVGQAPFTLNFTGIYNQEPFSQTITIEENHVVEGDSLVKKAWYGQHIRELEKEQESNEQVSRVLFESINERILSIYTAFLCLEPSDTIAVCTTCDDESKLTGFNDLTRMESDSVQLYPNPCTDFVNISFETESNWNPDNTSIEIFSILGEVVFSAKPEFSPGQKIELQWDLANKNGSKVINGYYLVRVSNGHQSYNKRLIVN